MKGGKKKRRGKGGGKGKGTQEGEMVSTKFQDEHA